MWNDDSMRTRWSLLMIGVLVGAVLMAVMPAPATTGDGLVVGATNRAGRSTWLASRGPEVLKLNNTGTNTALELRTASGVPPMEVSSAGRVDNLNCDMVDGRSAADFLGAAEQAADSALLGGKAASEFLGSAEQAADSARLEGRALGSIAGSQCPPGETLVGYDRTGPTCSSAVGAVAVDSTGDVGRYASMVLDASGIPVIAYYDATNGDLKLAHCSDAGCSSATINTVVSTDDVGQHASMVLDAMGIR